MDVWVTGTIIITTMATVPTQWALSGSCRSFLLLLLIPSPQQSHMAGLLLCMGFPSAGWDAAAPASSRGQCWFTNRGQRSYRLVYFVLSLWFVRHPERHSPRAVFRQEPLFPPGWEALFPVLQPLAEWANDCCCYWTTTKTMFPSLKHSWYEIFLKYGSFLQAPYYYTSED